MSSFSISGVFDLKYVFSFNKSQFFLRDKVINQVNEELADVIWCIRWFWKLAGGGEDEHSKFSLADFVMTIYDNMIYNI